MGPQIAPADIPPPANIPNIPAHRAAAHQSSSRFNGYLDEARSRAVASPVPASDHPSPQDQAPEPGIEDKNPQADDHPDGNAPEPPNPAGLSPAAATPIPVVPVLVPQDVVLVPTATASGEAQPPTHTQNEENASQTRPTPNPLPQETLTAASDANQPTTPVPQSSETPAHTIRTEVDEKAPAQSAGDQLATPADKASRIASEQATATIQAAKEQPRPPTKDAPSEIANKPAPSPRAAAPPASDSTPPQAAGPESSQPHRVAPVQAARRQDLADARNTDAQPQPAKTTAQPHQIRGSKYVAISAQIRDGQGDGAAASIARFLLSSNATSGTSAANGTAAASSANTSALAAAAGNDAAATPPAAQAGLVADLLAAGVQDGDAIEGAARLIHASGKAGRFRATMQLDPPDLGQLRVQIQLHPQGLNLHVDVATRAVAKLIESNLTNLRDALAVHGIQIDRAHVTVRAPAQPDQQAAQDQSPTSQGQSGRQSQGGHAGQDHGEPPPRHTDALQIIDPHPVVDLDGRPNEKSVAAPGGSGTKAIQQNRPTVELSVDLVA